MKALFINGSPRKNWNTHKMLDSAMKGASEAGAECELVHLYDMSFKGCMSCFACKLKNSKTNGVCAIRDALRPVLEKALSSDVLVMGSPIYFSYPTGPARSFLERLMFPVLSYNVTEATADGGKILDRTIQTAMIYTMGLPEDMFPASNYETILGENERFLKFLFGDTETLYVKNTYQFGDYSRYDVSSAIEPMKAKYRDEHFEQDLQAAYELGKRLVAKAKGE
ncbi:MAG: flavodoxin family protein [Synergistaceae bacterium]|nr:flavodoxin family protein [Synergistaceae bacterium]MBR0095344.1 flavodoxin family protein [Synergistaceae bacterium]